jgi:succinoglycan biosynthesis protein ExoM
LNVDLARQSNCPAKPGSERVAVCICTRKRPTMFSRCLSSVLDQQIPESSLDLHIVVVDNSRDAEERGLVAQRQDARVSIHDVHEPKAGIPVARNAALDAAKALSPDWIVFIDDDEIAPRDWLSRLHATARHYGADVTYGMIAQVGTAAEAQKGAADWRASETFGAARERKTCSTGNVIFRPWITMEPLSLRFDEAMGYGGSDTEFFMRANQGGARIVHVKDAAVFEEYPAERRAPVYEMKRAFRVGMTTNYRYVKNLGTLRGSVAVAGRAADKLATALLYGLLGIVAFPFARSLAERSIKRSYRAASFVLGCLGPAFGVRMGRYW